MLLSRPRTNGKSCALVGLAAAVILGAGSCASTGGKKNAAAPASPEQVALSRARQEFFRGREAALSGDYQCAQDAFGRALESVRPAGST